MRLKFIHKCEQLMEMNSVEGASDATISGEFFLFMSNLSIDFWLNIDKVSLKHIACDFGGKIYIL
jgi:hypothetical protein